MNFIKFTFEFYESFELFVIAQLDWAISLNFLKNSENSEFYKEIPRSSRGMT